MEGDSQKLLKTAIFGIVKLLAAVISAVFFIDQVGRKRTLLTGVTLQLLALLYVAIFITIWDDQGNPQSTNAYRAAIGAIVSIYVTGIGYALGWNSIQYLINAEILPTPVRTLGVSLLMCIHYANRFALIKVRLILSFLVYLELNLMRKIKALPTMMLEDALQPQGTFWFFFVVAFLGLLWGILCLPETSQKGLEETSEMMAGISTINLKFFYPKKSQSF